MYQQKLGERAEHRQREGQRVKDSASLADTFRKLKSLRVDLEFLGPDGSAKGSEIKYDVNLGGAKSVFRFNCPNDECIRGDFDLSGELAKAVAERQRVASGKMVCKGWRSKTTIDTVRCGNILKYNLSLGY